MKTFEDIISFILETYQKKDSQYSSDVIDELPLDAWLRQIQIKSTRAVYAITLEKKEDEILDTAVYSILALEKIYKEK